MTIIVATRNSNGNITLLADKLVGGDKRWTAELSKIITFPNQQIDIALAGDVFNLSLDALFTHMHAFTSFTKLNEFTAHLEEYLNCLSTKPDISVLITDGATLNSVDKGETRYVAGFNSVRMVRGDLSWLAFNVLEMSPEPCKHGYPSTSAMSYAITALHNAAGYKWLSADQGHN